MSLISRAEKNTEAFSPQVVNTRPAKIPVVLSDSKGKYLQHEIDISHFYSDIIWMCKPGKGLQFILDWLKQNVLKIFHNLGSVQVALYIFVGTCDLTIKDGRYISLKSQDSSNVSERCSSFQELNDFVCSLENVTPTFLELPHYSIYWWNKFKGHSAPVEFIDSDKTLKTQIELVNKFLIKFGLNEKNHVNSPQFNLDLVATRKRRHNKHTTYSIQYRLYLDGIHPGPLLNYG